MPWVLTAVARAGSASHAAVWSEGGAVTVGYGVETGGGRSESCATRGTEAVRGAESLLLLLGCLLWRRYLAHRGTVDDDVGVELRDPLFHGAGICELETLARGLLHATCGRSGVV